MGFGKKFFGLIEPGNIILPVKVDIVRITRSESDIG